MGYDTCGDGNGFLVNIFTALMLLNKLPPVGCCCGGVELILVNNEFVIGLVFNGYCYCYCDDDCYLSYSIGLLVLSGCGYYCVVVVVGFIYNGGCDCCGGNIGNRLGLLLFYVVVVLLLFYVVVLLLFYVVVLLLLLLNNPLPLLVLIIGGFLSNNDTPPCYLLMLLSPSALDFLANSPLNAGCCYCGYYIYVLILLNKFVVDNDDDDGAADLVGKLLNN
jgi:hypothetical protein